MLTGGVMSLPCRLAFACAALVVIAGCSESTPPPSGRAGPSPSGDADPSPSGSDEAGGAALDTGGPLASPFTCPTDGVQQEPRPAAIVLEQLRGAAGLDVLEERAVIDAAADAGAPEPPPQRAGTPCATASDTATCEAAFAQLSSGGEVLRPPFDEADFMRRVYEQTVRGYFLAYTKGDAVGTITSTSELRALFPSASTPATALVYANAAGYRVECQRSDGWIREETDGWVIRASRGHERRCLRTDVVLWLGRDGALEERDVLEAQKDPCT